MGMPRCSSASSGRTILARACRALQWWTVGRARLRRGADHDDRVVGGLGRPHLAAASVDLANLSGLGREREGLERLGEGVEAMDRVAAEAATTNVRARAMLHPATTAPSRAITRSRRLGTVTTPLPVVVLGWT